jgi:hypothetical protein
MIGDATMRQRGRRLAPQAWQGRYKLARHPLGYAPQVYML